MKLSAQAPGWFAIEVNSPAVQTEGGEQVRLASIGGGSGDQARHMRELSRQRAAVALTEMEKRPLGRSLGKRKSR